MSFFAQLRVSIKSATAQTEILALKTQHHYGREQKDNGCM
jgi:hypothetical protein